jgi:hypothetical protein
MSALDLPSGRIQRVAGVQLMGYVGTRHMRRHIRPRSFSTRREWSSSRRSAIATAIVYLRRTP